MRRLLAECTLVLAAFTASLPAAFSQTPDATDRMKSRLDSLRDASRSVSLKEIDPKMDAVLDSLLAIQVDSSEFRGGALSIEAVEVEDLCRNARLYAEEYDYEEALESYQEAFSKCRDSVRRVRISEEMLRCENGLKLMEYCCRPTLVEKKLLSLDDFFLYYPMGNGVWRQTPALQDTLGGRFARALYAPAGASEIFFSLADSLGVRGICTTHLADTAWTLPAPVAESFLTGDDSVYPVVRGDRMYFSSRGLYGVGGYDIYVSKRGADGVWGTPENLGFPFNSPYDDFLYMDTDDGRYSMFASNRECSRDSVCVYVLEYESMPVRSAVGSASELFRLCSLRPTLELQKVRSEAPQADAASDSRTRSYMEYVAQVRALRDTMTLCTRSLDALRSRYASASDFQKAGLAQEILAKEMEIPALQKRLEQAGKQLQEIEMEFLSNGIVVDPSKLASAPAKEERSEPVRAFVWKRRAFGDPLNLDFETPPAPSEDPLPEDRPSL